MSQECSSMLKKKEMHFLYKTCLAFEMSLVFEILPIVEM